MSSSVRQTADSDVHITQENQKKINTFAVRNDWLQELEAELKIKESELKNLEDAETEVGLLLEPVPILVGDSFVHYEPDSAGEELTNRMAKTKDDVKGLQEKIRQVKQEMDDLKTDLYERFGDSINLENES